jgi:voltage-gated potassium channel
MQRRHTLKLRIYLALLAGVFITGMLGLMYLEKFPPLDAFYFIVSTISTVGFGDLHPVTPEGKILVIFIILTGVGCFVGVVANGIEILIDERERRQRFEKLNMIIGAFFSEMGTNLLKKFSAHDPMVDEIRAGLIVTNNWSTADFVRAEAVLKHHSCKITSTSLDLEVLRDYLVQKRHFLLTILENPQIIEHDSFVPLIQAIFHLTDELMARDRLAELPPHDYDHLSVDVNRVYAVLIVEWLSYMHYLKLNYPYFFSLAMRTNPFDTNASPIVQ